MPKHISTERLAQMQRSSEDRMMDTAVIMNRTTARDAAGQPIATWSDGSTISCGFGFSPFKFRSRELDTLGGEESSEILVRVRVSLDYQDEITETSRIRLTKRYGVTLTTPQTYEVQGFNEIGPSAMVVNLRRTEL